MKDENWRLGWEGWKSWGEIFTDWGQNNNLLMPVNCTLPNIRYMASLISYPLVSRYLSLYHQVKAFLCTIIREVRLITVPLDLAFNKLWEQ